MRRLFGDRSGHAAPAARGRIAANAGGTWSDVRTMLKYDGNDYRLKLWISGITNCAACEVFERAWFTATARTLLGSPWNKPPQSNYTYGHIRHRQEIERRVVIYSNCLPSLRAAPSTPTPITWTPPPPCPRCSDGRTQTMQTQTRRVTVQTLTQT